MNHLLCGAAEQTITPPLGLEIPGYFEIRLADAVKSELKAHTIVLDDGATVLVIIHLDIIDFQASLAKQIRNRLKEELGLKPSCVMIAATHTHTGTPSNYPCLCQKKTGRKELVEANRQHRGSGRQGLSKACSCFGIIRIW